MNLATRILGDLDVHRVQATFKWSVYALLVVNFGFYVGEDVGRSLHTLNPESSLREWANTFAASIDILAWLLLLAMLELETSLLDDRSWKDWVPRVVRGTRLVCFAFIAHTVFAYSWTVNEYAATQQVAGVSGLCQLAGADVSFVYNLQYTEVDENSCRFLSSAAQFFFVGSDPVVTTAAGLRIERGLAWADLIEIVTWLAIIAAIEAVVRMQGRGITDGGVVRTATAVKYAGYCVIFGLAAYWASLSHWLYTWDTFVWVAGFAVIESNISEWRRDLLAARASAPRGGVQAA